MGHLKQTSPLPFPRNLSLQLGITEENCAVCGLISSSRNGDRVLSCLQALVCNNKLNMKKLLSEKQEEVVEV